MEENKELREHIKSIGEWATQDSNRTAFVVCGELTEGGVKTANAPVGRADRIAGAVFGTAMEDESFKQVVKLATKMMENPLIAALLCREVSKIEASCENKTDFSDALVGLLDAIKDKIKHD